MINYPYLPKGKTIKYVPESDRFIKYARKIALERSLDYTMPGGAVIVKDNRILGSGANGSNYHEKYGCERVRQSIPTGQNYELCEGCHPKNHSEARAIQDVLNNGFDVKGSDIYLWGHWWLCESCWSKIIKSEIINVFLLKDSEVLFNKNHKDNIIGKQFDE